MHQQIKSISVLFMLSILVCASGEATIIELGELQEDTLHISSNMKLGGVDKPIQLVYSTFLGGVGNDKGKELACDSKNNVYVLGSTYGSGFPIYDGYNDTYGGSEDAVLSSFDEDGNLRWSTYLGGEDAEYAQDIAIDSSDNIYVTGSTYSSDFPTKDAYQESSGGISDIFLTSFSPNGSMRWSTYLGGDYTDDAEGISVDSNDLIYIAGSTSSPNFPTKNPYQASNNGSSDVFISAFYPNGSLEWSSYYGGNMPDKAMDISFDHNGNMYLTGYTKSDNFPMLNAYDNTRSSSTSPDIFISSFSPQRYLRWSTYFHGQGEDIAYGIAFDSSNNLYLTGYTNSTDFPTILAYQSVYGGTNADAFVSSFTPTGTIRWSTFLGGENSEYAFDIGVDANDFIYVTGLTRSGNFPVVDAIQEKMSTSTFNEEMFISSFAANGSLHWSTYLGDQSNNHDQAWGIHMSFQCFTPACG